MYQDRLTKVQPITQKLNQLGDSFFFTLSFKCLGFHKQLHCHTRYWWVFVNNCADTWYCCTTTNKTPWLFIQPEYTGGWVKGILVGIKTLGWTGFIWPPHSMSPTGHYNWVRAPVITSTEKDETCCCCSNSFILLLIIKPWDYIRTNRIKTSSFGDQ